MHVTWASYLPILDVVELGKDTGRTERRRTNRPAAVRKMESVQGK